MGRLIRGVILALLVCGWTSSASAQTLLRQTTLSTASASCTPTNCVVIEDLRGVPAFGVYINVGSSGTFQFEKLVNDSDLWETAAEDVAAATDATADGSYYFTNPGWRKFRVRASAISGNATVESYRGSWSLRVGAGGGGGSGDFTIASYNASFGTAGSADTQVMSVQGIASMTPLQVSGAATPAENFTNPTTAITVWALSACFDGSTWDRCLASTTTERAHGAAVTATSEVGSWGLGLVTAHGANPTAEAAGDASLFRVNRAGVPFIIGGHPNSITETATILDADGAQTNAALVSVSAGTKIVVTRLTVACSAANSVDVAVRIGFGTSTIAAASTAGTVGVLLDHLGISDAAGGGVTIGDGSGILGVGADDEDLRFTMADPVSGGCTFSATYFTIES